MDLSIFVMYSPDRLDQLAQMVRINSRMEGWDECDKILLVDGEPNLHPEGFRVEKVERNSGKFRWSSMWEAGVSLARREKLLYLDSDRVFPRRYLRELISFVKDNNFVFTDSLFGMKSACSDDQIIPLLDEFTAEDLRTSYSYRKDIFDYDPRFALPLNGPGKGAMSGSVGFTRMGYSQSGGVDPWFEGHGAYADTDFQKQCHEKGFQFVSLALQEIHLWHPKLWESGEELTRRDLEILSLNNWIYHAKKWNLGFTRPRQIAGYLKLSGDFVDRVITSIESGDFSPILE